MVGCAAVSGRPLPPQGSYVLAGESCFAGCPVAKGIPPEQVLDGSLVEPQDVRRQ